MSSDVRSAFEIISTSRSILAAYVISAIALVAISAIKFQAPYLVGVDKVLTDFDAFYIAGTLARRGEVADAYHAASMLEAQRQMAGSTSFMPWTYPPPFTLLVDGLAMLNIGIAFIFFVSATFALYVTVLRRIAGDWTLLTLIFLMPSVMLNLRTGQNGFLVAGLIGACLLAWRDRKSISGLPLGMLVIKPHLAVGVGLLVLLGRRWDVIAIAMIAVIGLAASATFVYGFEVWVSFLGAVKEATTFLKLGYYPMFRMSSVYATLLSAGLPATMAMICQGIGALIAVGLLIISIRARIDFRYCAAQICALSLFISPYSYDYDLTILGIGLAFVIRDLAERCSPRILSALLVLTWAATGYGMAVYSLLTEDDKAVQLGGTFAPALQCPLLVALCGGVFLVLRSAQQTLKRPRFSGGGII